MAWVTNNFIASAPHTRGKTGSLKSQATPRKMRKGRRIIMQHPMGEINA
jgi:hypothetical protein